MAYNRKRNRRNKEPYQKKILIRCKLHNKPVFDMDSCTDIKLKSKVDSSGQCKNCQHAY